MKRTQADSNNGEGLRCWQEREAVTFRGLRGPGESTVWWSQWPSHLGGEASSLEQEEMKLLAETW